MSVFNGSRVVVTGGAGMVGSHIVDAVLAAGAREVVALDTLVRGVPENLTSALTTGRVQLRQLDIRDREATSVALNGADFVFHQAALRWTLCQEDPRLCQEVMVDGTFNVLDAAAQAKARKVVLASSAIVYGEPRRLPVDEDQPLDGTTVYGAAKVANEQMARAFAQLRGLPTVALRYFNVYGERMDIRSRFTEVMIKWLDRIDAGQPPLIFGDGTDSADYIHVSDVARANLLACESAASGVTLNVCTGIETTLDALASALLERSGGGLGVEKRPRPPGALPARRVGDPARAEAAIGFRATVGLAEGLRSLVAWRREALAAAG